ncbi:hypothetical protein CTA2_6060 [Colletotrichum tanaceti]|nr:hypothetical protein CTA2_6060 [Colletotrichum tanaceti]
MSREPVAVPPTVSAACPAYDSPCPKAPLFATDASGRQSRALARTVAGLISSALHPSGARSVQSAHNNRGRVWSALFRGSGGTHAHIVRQRKILNEGPPGSF